MKSVVYKDVGNFEIQDRPLPEIQKPTDAVVRITMSSICSSDLHIMDGSVPRAVKGTVVGHEAVGIVESVGESVSRFKVGDRVAVNVETFCGDCFFCRRGYVNNCEDPNGGWAIGCRIDGVQASHARIPYADNSLSLIPENVTDESALFTGDILSTGYWAADISEIKEGDVVAIIGAGPTGLCCSICSKLHNPSKIIMIDISDERLEHARKYGIGDVFLNPEKDDIDSVIKSYTDGRGADIVMEVAGGKDTFQTAWKIARPNATVSIIAMYPEGQMIPLPDMYGKNLTFKTGGVDASKCDEILKLISEGKIDTDPLITHRYPFSRIMEAYELFRNMEDGVIKVAIIPDDLS